MKKMMALLLAAMLLAAGCGQAAGGSGAGTPEPSPAADTAQEEAAAPGTDAPAADETEGESAGLANPWTDVESAEEAAAGAGLDGFTLVEGLTIAGDELNRTYRYMDGAAEMTVEFAASDIVVRKGTAAEDGDISGDYNTYAHTWTQNIKGLEVTCFGNREGEAMKTIWTVGDTSYSILAHGLGGDDDFGISADGLNSIINGLQ